MTYPQGVLADVGVGVVGVVGVTGGSGAVVAVAGAAALLALMPPPPQPATNAVATSAAILIEARNRIWQLPGGGTGKILVFIPPI